jgi:hypothetical protein
MSRQFTLPNGPLSWVASPKDLTDDNQLGIYSIDATQRYVLGTRHITWDGNVYKYAKAGATLDPDLGAKAYATQNLAYVTFAAGQTAAIGDRSLKCTFASTDGLANSGLVPENELAGGTCVIFSDTVVTQTRGITGNSYVAVGGGEATLYLDYPLQAAITAATSFIEAIGSPYLDVRNSQDATKSVIGLPVSAATTTYPYCWLQTWGKCWIAPQADVGAGAYKNQAVFRDDGSIGPHDDADAVENYAQHAGFVIQTAQAGGQGAPFLLLQISI